MPRTIRFGWAAVALVGVGILLGIGYTAGVVAAVAVAVVAWGLARRGRRASR